MCELVHYCGLTHNSMQIELNKNNNKNIILGGINFIN